MRVAIFGTGYVGLVTGACLAEVGHQVMCVDVDADKVAGLKNGIIPIYEPGLKPLVQTNHAAGRLPLAVQFADAAPHLRAQLDAGNVAEAHRHTRGRSHDRNLAEIVKRLQVTRGAHHVFGFA